MKNILITGIGSGLGFAMAQQYLDAGDMVYAIGRECPSSLNSNPRFIFFPYDLKNTFLLQAEVSEFIQDHHFNLAILNAGILGKIQTMNDNSLETLSDIMDINVWANKELIDAINNYSSVDQVVAISSNLAANGEKGCGAYSISKNALNMLIQIYAEELPHIHFNAIAPGIVRTPMIEYILSEVNRETYPAITKIAQDNVVSAQKGASRLINSFSKLLEIDSGSFVDIRKI
jgi:NAD(P)-dependent dehydrogenase (short-subunit alcohol dehydrogenase family)